MIKKRRVYLIFQVIFFLFMTVLFFEFNTPFSIAASNKKNEEFSIQDLTLKITKSASSKQPGEVRIIKVNSKSNVKNMKIPEQVKYNEKSYKIIEIGFKAFKGINAETIELPETIKTIEWYAFQNCINLKEISIPEATMTIGTGCFRGCADLKKVKLPKKLKKLSTSSFYGCEQLESINTSNLTEIGAYAFYNCKNLVDIDSENASIIYNNAFNNCSSLKKIDLSSWNSNRISKDLFKGCTSLTEINLSDRIETIDDSCFANLKKLQIINLEKIKTIGNNAFYNCTNLKEVNLNKVIYIGSAAFNNCTSLQEVHLKNISNLQEETFRNCISLRKVSVEGTLNHIGNYCFYGCNNLTDINLENISVLGISAFENCANLQGVLLPDYVDISENSFKGCDNLVVSVNKSANIVNYLANNNINHKFMNIPKLDIQKIEAYYADTYLFLKLTNISSDIYSKINGPYTFLDSSGDEVGGGFVNLLYAISPGESYILQIPLNQNTKYTDYKLDLTCSVEKAEIEDLSKYLELIIEEKSVLTDLISDYNVHFESKSPKKINQAKIQIIFYNNDKIVSINETNRYDIYKGVFDSVEHLPSSYLYTSYKINIYTY